MSHDPSWALVQAISGIQLHIEQTVTNIEYELSRPHILLRPVLSKDGNQWCYLLGENLQEGVAGFGDTPSAAALAFNKAFYTETIPAPQPKQEG